MSVENNPSEKTAEELKSEIAKLEADKAALTGELTDTRPKIREANEQIELLKDQLRAAVEKNNADPEESKIAEVVARTLAQRETARAEANRKAAFDKFVAENKDYHPDNDVGGLKLAALSREFAQFNTSGLVETEDFVRVIGKANALLRGTDTPRHTPENPYSSTPSTPASPIVPKDDDISQEEKKLIERNGWSKEKFLSLKAKMPDMVEDLVAGVRP